MVKRTRVHIYKSVESTPGSLAFMHNCQFLLFIRRHVILPYIMSSLFFCTSCSMMQMPAFTFPENDTQAFAEQLFINGDFERAILEFEQTFETALNPEDKNQALYGLACTQMMLAHNDDQLIEAISNLQKWDANKGTAPFIENRHLLVLSLKQQGELIAANNKAKMARETEKISLIDDQKKTITQMTSTIEKLHNENKALQNQIEALEAIDENVQEKRKTL